ncbi:MAG: FHA domain-containing protein [Kiritimatiellae bacterium]|nr:FHA domain-containing protein [Kiritimatiellia bacterium]
MSVNVVFIKGSLAGMRFHIPDAGAVVGRSHSCGIRASESDVSGRHVQIVPAGNRAEMTVLSAHRAFVNGRRVPSGARTTLKSGDHIRLGESLEFAFMADDSAADAAGDSTSLFPETGMAGGGTRATLGTRATMATQATMATGAMDMAADDASTSDAVASPPQGARGGTPQPRMGILRSQGRDAADTTATFPTGIPTGSTHLPGDDDGDGDETQMLKTQVVSREELELLGRMYAEKRRRKTMMRGVLLGFAFLVVFAVYMVVMSRKPETELTIPKDGKGKEIKNEFILENRGAGGLFGLKYPGADDAVAKTFANESGGSNTVIRTRFGAKWDVSLLLVFSWYRDPLCLHETRKESFDRWAASNLVANTSEGDFTDLGLMNDYAFIGDFSGQYQGIRCLSREYTRTKGDTYYGVVSFFRYGDRCYVYRREVPDSEKERAVQWLLSPGKFMVFDGNGNFVKRHWEGLGGGDGIPIGSCNVALLRCEKYLKDDSPADWRLVEDTLFRILTAATEAGDADICHRAETKLVELRMRKRAKWNSLWAERTAAANSGDEAREKDVDRRVRAVFGDRDDVRYGLCRREKWWRRL